jgi:triphosphoribosyl-dephospho-CoA synthase
MISIGLCAQLACIWEATARKPGNVHRYRDFEDTTYLDFLLSAAAIAPILETASQRRIGETVLKCIQATRTVVRKNSNLGIVLLLSPLAAVPLNQDLRAGLRRLLDETDVDDAKAVYEAIRLANPGGLGQVPDQDIRQQPTLPLQQVMALAKDRDLVARQYATGFQEVLDANVTDLFRALGKVRFPSLEKAIIYCHLHLMARFPDTLIARKRSEAEAWEASKRAIQVLAKFRDSRKAGWQDLKKLDAWLRAEGNHRNPGTTADLVTACLFIALREGSITLPLSIPFSAGKDHG